MRRHRVLTAGLAAALAAGVAIGGVQLTRATSGTGTATSVVPVEPYRILDTRNAIGAPAAALTGGGTIDVQIAGVGPVPADAVGVVLNVTGTRTTEATYITAWPTGAAMPTASVLNLTPGIDAPNAVTALLGDGGRVSFFNFTGSTDLIADVAGYLVPAGSAGGGGGTGPAGPQGPAGPPGSAGPTAATFAYGFGNLLPSLFDTVVANVNDPGQGGNLTVNFPARIVIEASVSVYAEPSSVIDGYVHLHCGSQITTVGVAGSTVDAGPRIDVRFEMTTGRFGSEIAPFSGVYDVPAGTYSLRVVCRTIYANNVRPATVPLASLTAIAVAR